MKLVPLFAALSVAANAALLALFFARPVLAPQAFRDYFVSAADRAAESTDANHALQSRIAARTKADLARAAGQRSQLWATLHSDDLATLVARLRAAGFPPAVVRMILDAEVETRFRSRAQEILGDSLGPQPYWKPDVLNNPFGTPAFFEKYNQLYRERSKILRDLLGSDFFAYGGDPTAAQRRQFGDISASKIALVQRINDDYAEMTSQIRAATQGITLPEDREKLALLEREKRADLVAMLTPQELADYEMRTSNVTGRLRTGLTLMDATEDEFRTIYKIQQQFNDQIYPTNGAVGNEMMEQRRIAQEEQARQLKAALGDVRYADFSRSTNPEFRQLNTLAQRENLSPDVAKQAWTLRDNIAQESNRIAADAALAPDAKRAALTALAQSTRTQILSTLGPTAGNAYIQTATRWLSSVERGNAVTFPLDGGVTNVPLPAAGTPAPTK